MRVAVRRRRSAVPARRASVSGRNQADHGWRRRAQLCHSLAGDSDQSFVGARRVRVDGAGGRGEQALDIYKWTAKADSEGFIVVAPDASRVAPDLPASFLYNPTVWNDGSDRGGNAVRASDDVGMIDALIEELTKRYPIDRRRIYATGFSSGASMVQRLGIERAKVLAAIAPVAGYLWSGEVKPERGLSVLYLIGNGEYLFETKWSKASDIRIVLYNDPPSIDGVAIAVNVMDIADVIDASIYDFSSRTRRLGEGCDH